MKFIHFYSEFSRNLDLDLTEVEIKELIDTVFVDDSLENLEGAEKFGIAPILIAANPASDVASPYLKIHSLSELLD